MNRNTPQRAWAMYQAMLEKPCTREDLCKVSGLSKIAVSKWLADNREHWHIVNYVDDARGRKFTPSMVWGPGEDAPRPGPSLSAKDRMRRLRQVRRNQDLFI